MLSWDEYNLLQIAAVPIKRAVEPVHNYFCCSVLFSFGTLYKWASLMRCMLKHGVASVADCEAWEHIQCVTWLETGTLSCSSRVGIHDCPWLLKAVVSGVEDRFLCKTVPTYIFTFNK